MTLTRSFIQNAPTTPLDARLMNMAGIVQSSDGTPRIGVLGGAVTTLVTALATMNVAVAAAEFATSKSKADGVAIFTNDGTVNVAITAAPASNSRIDVIWVKHNDDTTGDANALPVFGVTAGVAAASPTKPAIPTGALELATLRVYAGTTAANGGANTLVNTFAMTVARGGIVPFRTEADLVAWTTAADGQYAVDLATGALFRRRSGAWVSGAGASFPAVAAQDNGTGTATVAGTPGALTGVSASVSVDTPVACRAKISVMFRMSMNAAGSGATVGVALTGATTLNPGVGDARTVQVLQQLANTSNSYGGSWIVDINAGVTNFAMVAQIMGLGSTRTIGSLYLLVEPVAE